MMFLDLLLGILSGMFIAAITALVIVVTCGWNCYKKSEIDLMMLTEKKEGWVNVYKVGARLETGGNVHSTKDAAIKCIDSDKKHIATVKIEWEE